MGAKRTDEATKQGGLLAGENPLVPNKVMLAMYGKMLELRLLDEQVQRLQGGMKKKTGVRLESTQGQEACRVGLLQGLEVGDLVLDAQAGVATEYLLGTKLGTVLKDAEEMTVGTRKPDAVRAAGALPYVADGEVRLSMGMGASLLLKTSKQRQAVVVLVKRHEVAKGAWRRVLEVAGRQELPVIFVVLPEAGKEKRGGGAELCGLARKCGVPGIPVDASDAIALYRVAQESLGRIRMDGGPVLVEGIGYALEGERKPVQRDAVLQMGQYLLARKVCTEAWMAAALRRFAGRLARGGR